MERVDVLQSLFERAGGAKEVGKRSSLSRRRRSRAGVSSSPWREGEMHTISLFCSVGD